MEARVPLRGYGADGEVDDSFFRRRHPRGSVCASKSTGIASSGSELSHRLGRERLLHSIARFVVSEPDSPGGVRFDAVPTPIPLGLPGDEFIVRLDGIPVQVAEDFGIEIYIETRPMNT